MSDFKDEYTLYLLSETKSPHCTKLSSILWVVHDKINRYLQNNKFKGYDLFKEIEEHIDKEWWELSVDDSVTDKLFSNIWKSDLADQFWSWKHKKVVNWIDLITLFYTDKKWLKIPVNFRVVDKSEWKTKNEYFLEMLDEVLNWWINPSIVTWDSWYSSQGNLKYLISQGIGFLFWLKSNRKISKVPKEYHSISETEISEEWEIVHLKNVWFVKIFKKDWNYYCYRNWNDKKKRACKNTVKFTREEFEDMHKRHRNIEEYHRALKQLCGIEKHLFRNKKTIYGHIYLSIRAFCVLEVSRYKWIIKNRYQYIHDWISKFITNMFDKLSINNITISWF